LVPAAEALSDRRVSETALRQVSPQVVHRFTQGDQTNALMVITKAGADSGFMASTADGVVVQLAAHQPDNRLQHKRQNGQ